MSAGYGGYGGYPGQQGGYGGWNNYQQQPQNFNPYQGGGYQQTGYQQPGAYAGYGQESLSYDQSYNISYAGQAQGGPMGAPGWTEEWDPSSQRYYYFNRTTGVTQWEKPAELM
jgi:far upstream element-binding protein